MPAAAARMPALPEKNFARYRDLERLGCRSQQMDVSEREQYRAAIHGDREAFEMIIRTQSRTLFAVAYGILQNREEAEGVVQDSLVKAWKMRWRVRDPKKFPAWLSMIARHRAHDVFRNGAPILLTKHDWRRDCIPRPLDNCDCCDRLDCETVDARPPVGGTVAAATHQRVAME